jgi:hypothetical protein
MTVTEQDWLNCADPPAMLKYLRGKVSDRKLRLFAVACARRHPDTVPQDLRLIKIAERFADGLVARSELPKRCRTAEVLMAMLPNAWEAAQMVSSYLSDSLWEQARSAAQQLGTTDDPALQMAQTIAQLLEQKKQTDRLRCIIGNPFRGPPGVANMTSAVIGVAQGIYDERAFERLPILADALEEAGCTDVSILEHCRGPGPHFRGCWVVDWLLGKQ